MKSFTSSLTVFASKLDSDKVRLAIMVGTLVLFVLSAGAPSATGGVGH